MKVLVVSFDKTLTEGIKKALEEEGHEVYLAKNSEEAIKVVASDMEGVIYDAISGSISEEEINTLYQKKFSNARYIVLQDDLFPIDPNNIIVPQKLILSRETDPKQIVRKLTDPDAFSAEVSMEPEIETTAITDEGIKTPQEEEETPEAAPVESVEDLLKEVEENLEKLSQESPPPVEEVKEEEESVETQEAQETLQQPSAPKDGLKILIVSFDQALIDSLKAGFGQEYVVENVKTVKQAMEKGKDAHLIVFDAISGVIAERGLIEMTNDETLANKPYIILVDDLFPINVDGIPLPNKVALSRNTDPEQLKNVVKEELAKIETSPAPAEEKEEKVEKVKEEETVQEVQEEPVQEVREPDPLEEEIPALKALGNIIEEHFETPVEEIQEEPIQEQVEEEAPVETQEVQETLQQPSPQKVEVSLEDLNLEEVLSKALRDAISEEKIKNIVSEALEEKMADVRDTVNAIVRREIERLFEEIDVRNLIKQVTYQVLKEKLDELIT